MNMISRLTVLAASLALPMAASAAIQVYSFNLDSAQEVPPNASMATGYATLTIDDALDTISFVVQGFDLEGSFLAAHIHGQGLAGTNAGAVFNLVTNADVAMAFPLPNSYLLVGSNKAAGASIVNDPGPSLADDINAQPWLYYVNLHTDGPNGFPGGEIRGQLAPIPEASTYAMMLGGLGLVGFMAARRRRSV